MFEDNLYTVVKRQVDDGNAVFDVKINAEHSIFEGHFPNNAVFPGVCSLMLIRKVACEVIGREMRYEQIKECKFLAVILPDKCACLEVNVLFSEIENRQYKIGSTISCNGNIMVKLKAIIV